MKNLKYIIIGIALVFVSVFTNAQTVYTVTKTTDPDPFEHPFNDIDSLCDPEMYGSLRWAVNKVNSNTGESVIVFDIAGTGVQEIFLNSYLPQIRKNVTIDGTTQNGYDPKKPKIKINGQILSRGSCFTAYNCSINIEGIWFANFSNNVLDFGNVRGSEIKNNRITHILNTSKYSTVFGLGQCENISFYNNIIENESGDPNSRYYTYGFYFKSSNNMTVGGTEAGQGNTITNCRTALFLGSSQHIKISGNRIYNNDKAMEFLYGSNGNIKPPTIHSYDKGILKGTALPNSTIEVFGSTGEENANEYLTSTVADGNGEWGMEVSTEYEYFVATQRDEQNNSSNLSNLYYIEKSCSFDCPSQYSGLCNLICNSNMECPIGYDCGEEGLPPGWCSSHGTSNGNNWGTPPQFLSGQVGGQINFWECGGGDPFNEDDPGQPHCPTTRGEGVITKLLSPLIVGQTYRLSFYRAHYGEILNEGEYIGPGQIEDFYIKLLNTQNVEIPFGPNDYILPEIEEIPGYCETKFHEQPIVGDYIWHYEEFDFEAQFPYDAIWLYSEINTEHHYGVTYINGVKLIPINEAVDEVSFGPACANYGEILQLSVNENAIEYEWSGPNNFHSNDASPIVAPIANNIHSGTYYVTVTMEHDCIYTASVEAYIQDVNVTIGSFVGLDPENNWTYIFDYSVNEYTICPDSYHTIRAEPNGASNYSYEWNDGTADYNNWFSQINASPLYAPYVYMVTVTSDEGCTASDSFTINHHPVPPAPEPTNTGPYCHGEQIILNAPDVEAEDQTFTYCWMHTGSTWSSGWGVYYNNFIRNNGVNTYFCNGTTPEWLLYGNCEGPYHLTVINQFGCTNNASTEVEISPQIIGCIFATNTGPYCYGDEIVLSVENPVMGGGLDSGYSYEWSGPNNWTGSGFQLTVGMANPDTDGTYYLTITNPDFPECAQTLSTEVIILEQIDLGFNHASPYCEGETIKLTPYPFISESNIIYNWYGPNGWITSNQVVEIENATIDMTGVYYYTVTTQSGCISTSPQLYIIVDPLPELEIEILNHVDEFSQGSVLINYDLDEMYGFEISVEHNQSEIVVYEGIIDSEFIQLDDLISGQYIIHVTSINGCQRDFIFFILGSSPLLEIICDIKPRTCNSSISALIEITFNGGYSPYIVNLYSDGNLISEDNVFEESGTYSIFVDNLPTPSTLITCVITDAYMQSVSSECGYYDFAWSGNDPVTSQNLMNSYSNQNIYIGTVNDQTLNIPHNVTFTNCTIYTATYQYSNVSQTQWTVYNPYDLVLDNTTIQSGCPDQMWQGIKAWGGCGAQSPDIQALVEIKNESLIMDAIKAVESVHGAIVKATNSNFVNNCYDIYMHPHCSQYSLTKVDYNIFKTEGKLNNPDLFPKAHVYLDNIRNLTFKGNTFTNLNEWDGRDYVNKRGIGIDAKQSYFVVTPVSPTSASLVNSNYKNSFNGLYYGVRVSGQRTYPPKIQHNLFTNNFRGVKLTGTTGARVIYNTFYTLNVPVDVDTHFGYTANNTMSYDASYAAYLDRATNTWFEENKIFEGMAGVYVYNTGTTGTRFYRNNFGGEVVNNVIIPRGMDAATLVVGKNSDFVQGDPEYPGLVGLEVRCNDYTDNNFAISVFNGNMRKNQGIPGGQTHQLAGNQFNSTMVNGMEFNVNIQNEPGSLFDYSQFDIGTNYKYYQHDDDNDVLVFHRELLYMSEGVDAQTELSVGYENTESCPSNFGLHPFDHFTAVLDISARKSTLAGLQNNYNQTVDRGDTEYMVSIAENLSPHNFRQYVPILSNSGYLSDTVFNVLLNNTSAQKPVIASVLIANSPLPSEILEVVNNSTYLSNGHKKQINRYQTGVNVRVLLEYQISDIKQEIIDIEGEIVNNAVNNDSVPEALTLAIDYFVSKTDVEISDILTVYNLRMLSDDYQGAEYVLSDLRSMAVNLTPEESTEIITFCDVNEIYLACIDDTVMTDQLFENKNFLLTAARSSSPFYSALAEVLYSYTTDSVFYEYTPMPFEIVTPRSINIIENAEDEIYSIFEVYPNPTDGMIYIEYDFSVLYDDATIYYHQTQGMEQIDNCNFGEIVIYSNDAKILETISLESNAGKQIINLSNYVPGQYLIEIIDCYRNSEAMKITKK